MNRLNPCYAWFSHIQGRISGPFEVCSYIATDYNLPLSVLLMFFTRQTGSHTHLNALLKFLIRHTHTSILVKLVEEINQSQVVLFYVIGQFNHGVDPGPRLFWRFHATMPHLNIRNLLLHLFENIIKVLIDENILK